MSPLVSVIVLNWNGRAFLEECLQALERQTYANFEMLLVDNASTDGSQAYVRSHFPQVGLIELTDNLGFCGGNNAGYQRARGEYIALLNNDTRADPDWLLALVEALERFPEAGSAASKMVFYDKPHLIDTAGDLYFSCGIGAKRGHLHVDTEAYNEERFVFGACAGAALYRRAMLEQIGFLDDDFFIYDEDVDLSFRAQLAGWKCIYVPRARVLHHVSATMSKVSRRAVYSAKRNDLWVIQKNLPASLFWKHSALIIAYHLASDLKWMLQGYMKSVLRGRLDAFRAWNQVLAKRRVVQAMRTVPIGELEKIISHGLPHPASNLTN